MALITFLVEDNKTIRDNLVPALEDLVNGRVVGFAETESDALAWIAAHPDDWQLLIVDLFLKEGSGLGVLAGCKTRKPGQRQTSAHAAVLLEPMRYSTSRVTSTPSSSTATRTARQGSHRCKPAFEADMKKGPEGPFSFAAVACANQRTTAICVRAPPFLMSPFSSKAIGPVTPLYCTLPTSGRYFSGSDEPALTMASASTLTASYTYGA